MMEIREGQWLKMKSKPNVQVLVCNIYDRLALCQCDDGCPRLINLATLKEFCEPVEE